MTDQNSFHPVLNELQFFASPEHPCSYLDDRQATSIFVDPSLVLRPAHYSALAGIGFRRSGNYIYRPHCRNCRACVPVRIPVDRFEPNRSQRRTLKANQDVQLTTRPVEFVDEHYDLYRRYMQHRHPGGGMDNDDPDTYMRVLDSYWAETTLIEFRARQQLLAIAVTDVLEDGLSAVYTFFEPQPSQKGLGTLAILQQIELARQWQRSYLYLGYWIGESDKMDYKRRFQPLEGYDGRQWIELEETG
ncbi:MAG: arginyltransferase [Thiohalophilus sp.]|uniref:arginyltransferase n=1 Tax=Thiohalophilus sp. TaxID=3028392 RepID=UPI0028706773|nr:arginyltransferase [Thiohalophilus sp.]MDR9437110.1 arginyltransferase [Thiohalophilus sp.]